MKDLAPIVVFAYNRPQHLRQALEAIAANPEASSSELIVFQDGYKGAEPEPEWLQTGEVIKERAWCGSVTHIVAPRNKGCDRSVIDGVTAVCASHGRLIVIEDDLVVSPAHLRYMNFGLKRYENAPEVGSINGFNFKIDGLPPYFFIRGVNPWGWATWKRSWDLMIEDHNYLLQSLEQKGLLKDVDYGRTVDMLKSGRGWDVKWYASLFLHGKLGLFPDRSFVFQIGFDDSGTHQHPEIMNNRQYHPHELNLFSDSEKVEALPLREDTATKRKHRHYFFKLNKRPFTFGEKAVAQYYLFKHFVKTKIFRLG